MTPNKVHRNILFTTSPLQKYPIHQRERTKTCRSKPHYKGSDYFYTERSHDEENIENYEFMDELSKKYKEGVKDSEERNTIFKTLMKIHFQ